MKKLFVLIAFAALAGLFFLTCQRDSNPLETTSAEGPQLAGKKCDCTTIQDGVLTYSEDHYLYGEPIPTGYNQYGYNYQGHMFKGFYANVYLGSDGFPPYEGESEIYLDENPGVATKWYWPSRDVRLLMKWNDAWLSNKDCDGDGKLDRHYGYPSYIGSGAWETNHQSGEDIDEDGNVCKWNYFVKIVAAPDDATSDGSYWYAADGTEIGPVLWGSFAIIQQVYNSPCEGAHGIEYLSPVGPGFGKFKP